MDRRLPFNRIDTYIFGQLLVALMLVTIGLVALIWLTQSLRFIQIIVNHGLSPFVFVKLTCFWCRASSPPSCPSPASSSSCSSMPVSPGTANSPSCARRGCPNFALARPALATGIGAMLFCYVLNILLVPALERLPRPMNLKFATRSPPSCCSPGSSPPSRTASPSTSSPAARTTRCKASSSRMAATPPRRPPSSPAPGN